jgi:hypothetical protein
MSTAPVPWPVILADPATTLPPVGFAKRQIGRRHKIPPPTWSVRSELRSPLRLKVVFAPRRGSRLRRRNIIELDFILPDPCGAAELNPNKPRLFYLFLTRYQ